LIKEAINKRADNFFGLVEDYLNIKKLEEENILSLWFRYDDKFSRWLIKNYLICKPEYRDTYTQDVLSSVKVYDSIDILKNYYLKIFEEKPISQRLEERRRVVREFSKERKELNLSFIDEFLPEKIEKLPPGEAVKYITGTTPFEKEWIIKNVESIENLEDVYPELAYYIKDVNYLNLKPEQLWIKDYFREYRLSRLKNKLSERLLDILNERNANQSTFYKWYYSFDKVRDLLKEDFENIWIDALSLEFLPLIVNLLTKKGFYVDFNIAVANLPTSTEFNKVKDIERISDLDDFIHSQSSYRYPGNLIEEIEIVARLIDKISTFKDRFLIFSDHGFTSFANKDFQGRKLPEIRVAEREARYGALKEDINLVLDEDFMIYQPENLDRVEKYLIALRYDSFSYLSSSETHGGATPEEVLVPVIYASRIPFEETFYEIELLSNEITIRNPILRFSVKPRPITGIIAKIGEKEFMANYNFNRGLYELGFPGVKPGIHTITFVIDNFKVSRDIIIKGGSKEKDLL
ncbi:MAG: BREX-4 system phosphatase PglZ, partial [bacterium]